MVVTEKLLVEQMEVVVENKSFLEYLEENSIYFKTINDPTVDFYGRKVKEKKNKDKNDKQKDLATDPVSKLTTYMKIVNAVSE